MQNLRPVKLILFLLLLSPDLFSQSSSFEIFGTLKGKFYGKIYLFFEGDYRHKDSLASEIVNGNFNFRGKVKMPVQARLHLDQQSYIQDIFIDSEKTFVSCLTELNFYNDGKDTLNMLSVTGVRGSATENSKRNFESRKVQLFNSKKTDKEKADLYYQQLLTFITNNPASKLSPYLLGKATVLNYSRVQYLGSLVDTTLKNSFEAKSVVDLLNQIDKDANAEIGKKFHDFILPDSSGNIIDSRLAKGEFTLIVFWASWCQPCRAEHPDFNILFEKYKENGFQMIGLSLDENPVKWKTAIIKDSLRWPQVIDIHAFESETAKFYGIDAIPSNFLLDKEGIIIGASLSATEIEEKIKQMQ